LGLAANTYLRAQTPPVNDHFTNATLLTGNSVAFSGTLSNATFEPGEPYFQTGGDASVWWKWAPSVSTTVTIQIWPDSPIPTGAGAFAWLEIRPTSISQQVQTPLGSPAGRYVTQFLPMPTNWYYYIRVGGTWRGSFHAQLTASPQPVILQHPQDCTVSPYASAAFAALATGIPAPNYQWKFNGAPISGETAPLLLVYQVSTNAAGRYSVVVSNSVGVTESDMALLTVTPTNPFPKATMLGPTNGSSVFYLISGEPGRFYRSQITDDLSDWSRAWWGTSYAQATNVQSLFSTYLLNSQRQFVAVSLDTDNDACIAQLKAFHFAVAFYTLESGMPPSSVYGFDDLSRYFKSGTVPQCPGNGSYFLGATVLNDTVCSLDIFYQHRGHHWP
jgi:hypothetical protein